MNYCKPFAISLLFPVCFAMSVRAQQPEVERIVRDWKERRTIAANVLYEVQGTWTVPKGAFDDGCPKEDHVGEIKITMLMDFTKNWFRKEFHHDMFYKRFMKWAPHYAVELFDGQKGVKFEPREKNTSANYTPSEMQPDLHYCTAEQTDVFIDPWLDVVILMAHGMIPTPAKHPRPENLVIPIDAKSFRYHGEANRAGVACKVLRTPLQSGWIHEYWVDESRNSAVVRYRVEWNGNTFALTDIEYEKREQVWLPAKWTNTNYNAEKQLIASKSVKVVDLQLNGKLRKEDFQARLEEGHIVYKTQTGKSYRVRTDGTLEDAVLRGSPGISWWTWSAIILAFVVLAVVTFFVRRRRSIN